MMRWLPGSVALLFAAFCFCLGAQDAAIVEKSEAAKQALSEGRYIDAISFYRELVKTLPGNIGLRMNLAIALDKAGQPSAAIPELEKVTQAEPSSAPAWFLLGLAYQQLNRPRNAIGPLRKAVRLDNKNLRALLELGDAELTSGDPRSSSADFAALAAADPDMPKAYEGLGRAYVALGESCVQQIERQDSQSGYRYALSARAREEAGKFGEALRLYAKAIGLAPDLPGLHSARSAIYQQTNHPDWAAIETQREARLPKPECASRQAACAFLRNDFLDVVKLSGRLSSPENLYWTALASAKLAEQSFARLEDFPQSPELHAVLADSYQRSGRRLDAVAEWRKALALNPSDSLLESRLAESLIRARDYSEAERILTALVGRRPDNAEWQSLLGNVLFQQKRDEEALAHLSAAVRQAPELLPAQEALGRVYLDLDKPGEAVVHLEKARALDEGSISFALSSAYRKLGRISEANAALLRYQQIMKKQPPSMPDAGSTIPPPQ